MLETLLINLHILYSSLLITLGLIKLIVHVRFPAKQVAPKVASQGYNAPKNKISSAPDLLFSFRNILFEQCLTG